MAAAKGSVLLQFRTILLHIDLGNTHFSLKSLISLVTLISYTDTLALELVPMSPGNKQKEKG